MPLSQLKQFLDNHNVKYVVISHSLAYTAAGIAALTHIPGKELAKSVILKIDGALVMVVVAASQQVDLTAMKDITHGKIVSLATEEEFRERFPDCEVGAMPPFGNLYGMPVFADADLAQDEEIAFNAGSHRELVRIPWEDFARLAHPRLLKVAARKRSLDAARFPVLDGGHYANYA